MIERINASGKPVVAIDVPSGVDASTGEVPGAAVRADASPSRSARRRSASRSRPGRYHAGSVQVAVDRARDRRARALARAGDGARRACRARRARARSTAPGSVLVVGGSRGMTGAPMLAALAAFRADAGYVGVAAPESALPVIESRAARGGQVAAARGLGRPAARPRRRRRCSRPPSARTRSRSGPGLGRTDGTQQLVRVLLERLELPVVVDADALWELEPFARAAPTVLTPHSGELARLLGATAEEVDAHRLARGAARGLDLRRRRPAQGRGHAGRGAADGRLVAGYGQPSLATAGSGDVLTGVSPRSSPRGSSRSSPRPRRAVAHGLASRLVEPQIGLVASDLLPALQRALGGDGWQWPPLQLVRSEITIDLGAVRRNARRLLDALGGAELWAVVKANGYGHGARRLRPRRARRRRDRALRRDRRRGARAAARAARRADPRHGPGRRELADGARGAARARRQRRACPRASPST